jgi:hypothetical protein
MKGKPVGLEYLGDDFKVIILSVPLYYLDSLDAKKLVELVANEKFKPDVGIQNDLPPVNSSLHLRTFPNPTDGETTLQFYLPEKSLVRFTVFDILGNEVFQGLKGYMETGLQTIELDLTGFPAGVYVGRLSAGDKSGSAIMIVAK